MSRCSCCCCILALFGALRVIGMLSGTVDGRPHKPEEE